MPITTPPLKEAPLAAAQNQANGIGEAAQSTLKANQFVFFAAFDGTNNDRGAVYKS